jgi:hypothetical protein
LWIAPGGSHAGASIEFAVAKGVVEAAQAHESETHRLGDADGSPTTALEIVRQAPLEPKNAAGRQLNPAELRPVHDIPPNCNDEAADRSSRFEESAQAMTRISFSVARATHMGAEPLVATAVSKILSARFLIA